MNKNTYQTRNLYEASLLHAQQQKLITLEPDGNFFWFVFADKSTCEKLAAEYWSGDIEVKAKAYADSIRTLKDMLFIKNRQLNLKK